MAPIVRLQVVITPQILESIDNHVARLQQLFPGATISRSSIARDLLEVGFPHAEEALCAMEDARRLVRPAPIARRAAPASVPTYSPKVGGRPKR